ncbi:MAG: NAD(P)-binding protein [Bacteroidetes bacterium]|nr:NAD(P)-binding protein [Bacteroidota bacterium]
MKNQSIIILGGGVAGMSAAHELIERGFDVSIYEQQARYVGGKARSVDIPDSATEGKKPLPGEHGFRFFPGFYKHITNTMGRIPFEGNENGVLGNLTSTERVTLGREGQNVIINTVNFPRSKEDIEVLINALTHSNTHLTKADVDTVAQKIWQLASSCSERRLQDYETLAWWDYTDAKFHSDAYYEFFVGGLTRSLVAAKPRNVSTRTGGDILLQLLYQMASPGKQTDRVLNAPTNDAWLDPWYKYLTREGVRYHHGHKVLEILCQRNKQNDAHQITGIVVQNEKGEQKTISADYYISAVPVEVMAGLLNDQIIEGDSRLAGIKELAKSVSWMTGLQLYLNEDVPIAKGHVIVLDSPWAITAISQHQFWPDVDLDDYGNGDVKGILSIDISDWDREGFNGKTAKECTKQEVLEEVWCQLVLGLRENDHPLFSKEMLVAAFLDRDIQNKEGDTNPADNDLDVSKVKDCPPELLKKLPPINKDKRVVLGDPSKFKTINKEPLLVNSVRSWSIRPEAYCKIPNLFFASDYVRTYTDLATMEGANESARRAVNSILDQCGSNAKRCKIWNLHEPILLWPLRWYDRRRFRKGLPWKEDFPILAKILHWIMSVGFKLFKNL